MTTYPPTKASDQELLQCFVQEDHQESFRALIERHGPLVLGVCRRVLQNDHDVDDAFQATFLVLARKASQLRPPFALSSWLYSVAHRTAVRITRRAHFYKEEKMPMEELSEIASQNSSSGGSIWKDLASVLDEEMKHLPEKYRTPLLLCYFEGKTQGEAARELQWPQGSLSVRLSRAREMLKNRLQRRGVVLPSAALPAMLMENACNGKVPGTLIENVAIKLNVNGSSAHEVANEVIRELFLNKISWIVATCATVLTLTVSGFLLANKVQETRKNVLIQNFWRAVDLNKVDTLSQLLSEGMDPNLRCPDLDLQTALSLASSRGDIEMVQLLLQYPVDTGIHDERGFTALIRAVQGDHQEVVEFLLKKGVDSNQKDFGGYTGLHHAATVGNIEMVKLLLKYGADPGLQSRIGLTPLQTLRSESPSLSEITRLLKKAEIQKKSQNR